MGMKPLLNEGQKEIPGVVSNPKVTGKKTDIKGGVVSEDKEVGQSSISDVVSCPRGVNTSY